MQADLLEFQNKLIEEFVGTRSAFDRVFKDMPTYYWTDGEREDAIKQSAIRNLERWRCWHEDRSWDIYQEDVREKEGQGIPYRKGWLCKIWNRSIDRLFSAMEQLEGIEELETNHYPLLRKEHYHEVARGIMNIEKLLERYGSNGKFFLLTRDHPAEITELGGGFDGGEISIPGSLFHYANQVLYQKPSSEPDSFGRNYTDQMFIALCIQLHVFVVSRLPNITFKSLTARQEGDKYIARVQYDNEDLEMEVEKMYHYFCERKES